MNEENYSLFLRHILLCDVGKRNIAASTTKYLKQSRWLDVGESLVRYVMSHISLENEWRSLPILENPTHVLAGAIAKPGDVIFSTNRGEKYPIGAVQKSGDFKRFSFQEIQTWES